MLSSWQSSSKEENYQSILEVSGEKGFLASKMSKHLVLNTDICLPPACRSQCLPTGREYLCLYQPSSPIAPTSLPFRTGNFRHYHISTMPAPRANIPTRPDHRLCTLDRSTIKMSYWLPSRKKPAMPSPSHWSHCLRSSASLLTALLNHIKSGYQRHWALIPNAWVFLGTDQLAFSAWLVTTSTLFSPGALTVGCPGSPLPRQLCLDVSWTPLSLPLSNSELSSKLNPEVTCELSPHILYTPPLLGESATLCKNAFLRLNVRHSFSFTFLNAPKSLVAKPTSGTPQSKAQPFPVLCT